MLDRYPELDPCENEAASYTELIPGPSLDSHYDKENGNGLDISSHLWKEESFCEAEETMDRGITTLLMNLATLISNMDDLGDLAESMHIPRLLHS